MFDSLQGACAKKKKNWLVTVSVTWWLIAALEDKQENSQIHDFIRDGKAYVFVKKEYKNVQDALLWKKLLIANTFDKIKKHSFHKRIT